MILKTSGICVRLSGLVLEDLGRPRQQGHTKGIGKNNNSFPKIGLQKRGEKGGQG